MNKVRIFELNDRSISLARDEILLIEEFKRLYKRDRGIQGDAQGRKKRRAFQEFHYIYLMCDYDSYPNRNGLSESAAHKYSLIEVGFEEGYAPDDVVLNAMKRYINEQYNINKEVILTLLRMFRTTLTRIDNIRTSIDNQLETRNLEEADIDRFIKYQKELFTITTELPSNIERLEAALVKIKDKELGSIKMRGGGEIPDSADPDKSL